MISVGKLLEVVERRPGYSDVTLVPAGCAEPGYENKPMVLGNWNNVDRYDDERHERVDVDDTMSRLANVFERMGWEVEWEDEWAVCDNCGKAVRTQADSYHWQGYYWANYDDGVLVCGDCVKDDPQEYIDWLDGKVKHAMTIPGIDLTQFGYRLYKDEYESGLHPHQTDDPVKIAKELRAKGINHWIFVIDGVGQFDIGFSVWVKEEKDNEPGN